MMSMMSKDGTKKMNRTQKSTKMIQTKLKKVYSSAATRLQRGRGRGSRVVAAAAMEDEEAARHGEGMMRFIT